MQVENLMFLMIIEATPDWVSRSVKLGQPARNDLFGMSAEQAGANRIRRLCVHIPQRPDQPRPANYYFEYKDGNFLIYDADAAIGTRGPLATVPGCEPDFDHVIWRTLKTFVEAG